MMFLNIFLMSISLISIYTDTYMIYLTISIKYISKNKILGSKAKQILKSTAHCSLYSFYIQTCNVRGMSFSYTTVNTGHDQEIVIIKHLSLLVML